MAVVAAAGVGLASRPWYPEIISAHGQSVQRMLDYSLVVSGAFFVLGHAALVWLILSGRRGDADAAERRPLRRAWLLPLIPALGMALLAEGGGIVLGLPAWARYYGDAPPDAITVEAVGRQFFWTFRYPGADGAWGRTSPTLVSPDNPIGLDARDRGADDIVTLNELYVPVDRPVRVALRSYDVIHSFFVPTLRLKQDAVPGMTVSVWFRATQVGDYEIACNRICGLGHYRMKATLHVVSTEAFDNWLRGQSPLPQH
jgi:cytochrome c oxidase subunit 2